MDRRPPADRLDPAQGSAPGDLRNRALYTRTDKPGLFRTSVLKPVQLEQVLESDEVRGRWSVAVFLNQLPVDEALRLFREQGGG